MQGCIAYTNDKYFCNIDFMFVDAYNKLIISKSLQTDLLNSVYVIYARAQVYPQPSHSIFWIKLAPKL